MWFERAGGAAEGLIYGEREQPLPGDGEVLVRLRASAVNPSDVKKRAGRVGFYAAQLAKLAATHSLARTAAAHRAVEGGGGDGCVVFEID